jgi:DNA invertase Pin-like site-specific DNA recombinase
MNFDNDTPQGKFFFSFAGAFAEVEREITRERIMAGIERARKENKHLGRPPDKKDSKIKKKSGYYANGWKKEENLNLKIL